MYESTVTTDAATRQHIFAAIENSRGEFSPLCPVCKRWHVEYLRSYAKLHRCRDCGFSWAEYQIDASMIDELGKNIEDMQATLKTLTGTPMYADLSSNDSKAMLRAVRILTKLIDTEYKQLAAMLNAIEPRA